LTINDFKPSKTGELSVLNKWFLSRLNHVKSKVTYYLENMEPHKANRHLEDFFLNDFSRFYVHLVRDKLKKDYSGDDKDQVMHVLYVGMLELNKMLAPFMPFVTEHFYQNFFRKFEKKESIHLLDWPESDKEMVDRNLENEMDVAKSLIESLNTARQDRGAKLRWPIDSVQILPKDEEIGKAVNNLAPVIESMANVKKVDFHYGKFVLGKVMKAEALVNEVVRKTQILRKENKLLIGDRIEAQFKSDPETEKVLQAKEKDLLRGIGGDKAEFGSVEEVKGELEHDGKKVEIGFRKK
jgi:valyl-tRNA synthetase